MTTRVRRRPLIERTGSGRSGWCMSGQCKPREGVTTGCLVPDHCTCTCHDDTKGRD